ncbi:hypothetical protein ACH5AL_06980 [Actinacidiphila glaucinigra]
MSETAPEAGTTEEPEIPVSEEETTEEEAAAKDGGVVQPDAWHQT